MVPRVLVPAQHAEQAKEIIQEIQQPPSDDADSLGQEEQRRLFSSGRSPRTEKSRQFHNLPTLFHLCVFASSASRLLLPATRSL